MRTPISPNPQGDPQLDVFATAVPLTRFVISHSMFDFTVVVQNASGITVRDVLYALYRKATSREYHPHLATIRVTEIALQPRRASSKGICCSVDWCLQAAASVTPGH